MKGIKFKIFASELEFNDIPKRLIFNFLKLGSNFINSHNNKKAKIVSSNIFEFNALLKIRQFTINMHIAMKSSGYFFFK